MTDKDEMAALKARLAELEQRTKPPPPLPSEADVARYRDEMHQMRERNASAIPPWMHNAVAGGVTDEDARDLVRASHRPTGPGSAIPSSQQVTRVHPGGGPANVPGGGTGWQAPIPLSPPPGVAQADRLMDEQDRRDRAELAQKLGALKR